MHHSDQPRSVPESLGTRLYPELRLLPDRGQRREVFRIAQRQLFRSWWAWIVAVPVTVMVTLGLHYTLGVVQRWWALPRWLGGLLFGAAVGGYVFYMSTFVFVRRIREHIRGQLIDRGIPVCRKCGYALYGLSTPRCPECGTGFDPAMGAG